VERLAGHDSRAATGGSEWLRDPDHLQGPLGARQRCGIGRQPLDGIRILVEPQQAFAGDGGWARERERVGDRVAHTRSRVGVEQLLDLAEDAAGRRRWAGRPESERADEQQARGDSKRPTGNVTMEAGHVPNV
jgi:hypothetical protein